MLTMRPRRAFIMPRSTALLVRKTPDRLVSRIACQSSSFIRISSWSRVMPALFTRMPIGPTLPATSSSTASTEAGSATSSTRPTPPCAARRAPMAAAPASLVAVPTTRAPRAASSSAMAAPMPRLAPVTSAISPLRGRVCMEDLLVGAATAAGNAGSRAARVWTPQRAGHGASGGGLRGGGFRPRATPTPARLRDPRRCPARARRGSCRCACSDR